MATIHHSRYMEDISAQDYLRAIVEFLCSYEPKPGVMWAPLYDNDNDSGNEFAAGPIVYILKKDTTATADQAPMYVKLVLDSTGIRVLISNQFGAAAENDLNVLPGSQCSEQEDHNENVVVLNADGVVTLPQDALVPTMFFDADFDYTADRFTKAWMIRQLDPVLDNVGERKNTNLFFWGTVCTKEAGEDPITRRGYYQHITFGCAGETLTPDSTASNGPGLFAGVGSYTDPANRGDNDERVFAGAGDHNNTNTGAVILVGQWQGKQTWFYPATMYGYARDPFDESMLSNTDNVGFDFTELCKYSPYSGVRVLTPAYEFGRWDSLWRILCRLPVFYTDMAGLYAGDTISQIVDADTKNYMIFPFIHYRCSGQVETKRGYAVLVPNDEDV